MKNVLLTLSLILGLSSSNAQEVTKVGGFNYPESVASDASFLYVADIGAKMKPTDKDGDGKIIRLDKAGKVVDNNFFKEILNAPKGLAIDGDVLYVADVDRIVAFEIKTGKKLYEVDFVPQTSFLNDIAVWDKTTLYVSATDKSKLFKVNLTNKTFEEVPTDVAIDGINGLYADKGASRLYVNGFGTNNQVNGTIGYINLKDNKFTQLIQLEGLYDGITIYQDVLYFTNWIAAEKKGILVSIDLLNNHKMTVMKLPEFIGGPADLTVSRDNLVIPAMLEGTLYFVNIKKELMYIN